MNSKSNADVTKFAICRLANGAGQNAAPRVAVAGREVDELVRLNAHWLIQLRDVAPKE